MCDGNICPITFRKKMTFRTYFTHFWLILEQISLDTQNLKRFGIKILGFSFLKFQICFLTFLKNQLNDTKKSTLNF